MWARRAFASSIIAARRAALASSVAIWPSTRSSGVEDQGAALLGILGGLQAFAIALAGELVFEELADLCQREPGVVTQALDEPQALEVARVVQAIRAIRPSGRLEQADLLVVADRPGRQAGLGGDFLDAQQRCGGGQGHLPHILPQP